MDLENLRQLNVPHIDEYFGVWAIHEDRFRQAVAGIKSIDLAEHIRASSDKEVKAKASGDGGGRVFDGQIVDGVAIIEVSGTLMKFASSLDDATGTVAVRREIRAAVNDDRVKCIMVRIDSPGGTVSGTADLADDVAEAAQRKPLHAYIEDLGASAAYWIASQAGRVTAGRTAMVGSIGTFAVIYDLHGMAQAQGIEVHVLRAGQFKGSGTPGTKVTDDQLAEWQRIVDELNEHFLAGVAAGRKLDMERVRSLADGRVHMAKDAQKMKLIDGVGSFDAALKALQKVTNSASGSKKSVAANATAEKDKIMSEEKAVETAAAPAVEQAIQQPVTPAATTAELKAAFPDSTAEFRENCTEQGLTMAQATAAYAAILRDQAAEQAKTKTPVPAPVAKEPAAPSGVEPLTTRVAPVSAGDAIDRWNQAIDEKIQAGMKRPQAISAVVHENPELHEAYLAAYNAGHRR